MSNQLSILKSELKSPATLNKIAMALGFQDAEHDKKGQREAEMYMSSVFDVVMNANSKTKLKLCTPKSVIDCAILAAKQKIAIDGRNHASLIAFYNKDKGAVVASFIINSAGYEAKLHEALPNSNVRGIVIYDGDEFNTSEVDGYTSYTHTPFDEFEDDPNKIKGIAVVISWFENGVEKQIVDKLSKKEIKKIRDCAPQDFVWSKWFVERAKTACIKRSCKRFFSKVQGLKELVDLDNENYDLRKVEGETRSANSIIDNINAKIECIGVEDDVEVLPNLEAELREKALELALLGEDVFVSWAKELPEEEKKIARGFSKEMLVIAKKSDEENIIEI